MLWKPLGRAVGSARWISAAALLALLVSTNCGLAGTIAVGVCTAGGGGGGGSSDAGCEMGSTCDPGSGSCSSIPCTDGDLTVCPIGTTCVPSKGPGVCKPPDQLTCDVGQTCSPFPVRGAGGTTSEACGCMPR